MPLIDGSLPLIDELLPLIDKSLSLINRGSSIIETIYANEKDFILHRLKHYLKGCGFICFLYIVWVTSRYTF